MRVLHLYRPRLPGQRAQAIQVLHTCHALAQRGHDVTVLADRGSAPATPEQALQQLGLTVDGGLDIRIAPLNHSGIAGLWFRRELAKWWSGPKGVVLARDKRRLANALRSHGRTHRIILETHELDSALVKDRGENPQTLFDLEAWLATQAHAMVTNCGGTLQAWEEAHSPLPSRRIIAHNASSSIRVRTSQSDIDPVIRVLGSARSFKGIHELERMDAPLPLPIEWVGASPEELLRSSNPSQQISFRAAIRYIDVPDLLSKSQVLLLPLKDNRFGRSLTSPLKLWDYLATERPIVAPNLPTISEIADLSGAPIFFHRPNDETDLVRALSEASTAPPRPAFLRSWSDRARELEELFE